MKLWGFKRIIFETDSTRILYEQKLTVFSNVLQVVKRVWILGKRFAYQRNKARLNIIHKRWSIKMQNSLLFAVLPNVLKPYQKSKLHVLTEEGRRVFLDFSFHSWFNVCQTVLSLVNQWIMNVYCLSWHEIQSTILSKVQSWVKYLGQSEKVTWENFGHEQKTLIAASAKFFIALTKVLFQELRLDTLQPLLTLS